MRILIYFILFYTFWCLVHARSHWEREWESNGTDDAKWQTRALSMASWSPQAATLSFVSVTLPCAVVAHHHHHHNNHLNSNSSSTIITIKTIRSPTIVLESNQFKLALGAFLKFTLIVVTFLNRLEPYVPSSISFFHHINKYIRTTITSVFLGAFLSSFNFTYLYTLLYICW